jgi:hypothetical protein
MGKRGLKASGVWDGWIGDLKLVVGSGSELFLEDFEIAAMRTFPM